MKTTLLKVECFTKIEEIFITVLAAQIAQTVKLRSQMGQLYITLGLQTHVCMQYVHK